MYVGGNRRGVPPGSSHFELTNPHRFSIYLSLIFPGTFLQTNGVSRKHRPRKHRPQTADLENADLENTDLAI